jgi:hypothetical protein
MTKTFKIALEGAPAASFFNITDAAQAAKLLFARQVSPSKARSSKSAMPTHEKSLQRK